VPRGHFKPTRHASGGFRRGEMIRRVWDGRRGIELRPRGAPPPAPPRSFLAERGERRWIGEGHRAGARRGPPPPAPPPSFLGERGEFDGASSACRARPRAPPPARRLATSPNSGGGTPMERGSTTGTSLRPRGPLPRPLPARSSGRGENSMALRNGIALAPDAVPHPRPLPPRSSGRGENSIPLRRPSRRSPSPTQFVGEGRGGGRRRTQCDPSRTALDLSPTSNLPQQFWGRWARFTSPEGAPRTQCNSDRIASKSAPTGSAGGSRR